MPLASHLRCVALALGISTALGCANHNQPAPRAESLDPGLSRVAGTRGDALPAQWWTLYQDPGLNHLVAAALRHNRDLAAADAHARALLGHLRGAQGERWPRTEVGYGYQYGRDGDDQTLAEATDEDLRSQWKHTARLDLSYQLDLWGEVRARIAAAKADAEAAQAARDLLRVSVASQTTLAYVRACALARRAEVQRRSVGLLDASLALSERQLAAGLSSELQRRRLLALRERTRAALPMLEARRRAALYELALLSGRSPRQLDAPAATCAGIPQLRRALPTGDGWSLLARRPDVRAAERRLAAADARRALAEAELYPRISFAVGAETSAATLAGLGASGALAYAAGPLLSWRFPNRESARGRLDSAAAERDAALARFDGAVLGALREVERALALYAACRPPACPRRAAPRLPVGAQQLSRRRPRCPRAARQPTQPGRRPGAPGRRRDARRRAPGRTVPGSRRRLASRSQPLPSGKRTMNQAIREPIEHTTGETMPAATRRRRTWLLGGLAGAIALAALLAWWWSSGRFLEGTDDAYVRADWVAVSAQVSGYVAEVLVADDADVQAGDLLLRLDPRDFRQRLRAAEAREAAAQAALEAQRAKLETLDRQRLEQAQTISRARADGEAARAEWRRAETDWRRYRQLADEHATSRQRLENADAVHQRARAAARRASAEEGRQRAARDVLKSRRREAEAALAQRQAELQEAAAARELARHALDDTEIRAPFAGRVGQRKVRLRQYVTPGLPLLAVVPLEQAYVVANYKETQLERIRPGQPVELEVDTFGRRWRGRVDSVAPASGAVFALLPPDNATGNFTKIVQRFPVRIRLDADAAERGRLLPGMSVIATVDTREPDGASADER